MRGSVTNKQSLIFNVISKCVDTSCEVLFADLTCITLTCLHIMAESTTQSTVPHVTFSSNFLHAVTFLHAESVPGTECVCVCVCVCVYVCVCVSCLGSSSMRATFVYQ